MGVGQNCTTANPQGFVPFCHLPGFHFGYLWLTHGHVALPFAPFRVLLPKALVAMICLFGLWWGDPGEGAANQFPVSAGTR